MSDYLAEWVTVLPTDSPRDTARALLALADCPTQVRTLGSGDEFLVHPDVAERYTSPDTPSEDAPKPRRSRARKKTEEPQ